jgi:DNA-binding PadR family transcriptional regulator
MNKITGLFKRLVDKKIHKLHEAGLIDSSLELTDEGKEELLELLFMVHQEELAKRADEIIKENKKTKKDDDELEEV